MFEKGENTICEQNIQEKNGNYFTYIEFYRQNCPPFLPYSYIDIMNEFESTHA